MHHLADILTANLDDITFVLGMTIFGQVGLKLK